MIRYASISDDVRENGLILSYFQIWPACDLTVIYRTNKKEGLQLEKRSPSARWNNSTYGSEITPIYPCIFGRSINNYPWTPKPWKMKVLHPQNMGYNPKKWRLWVPMVVGAQLLKFLPYFGWPPWGWPWHRDVSASSWYDGPGRQTLCSWPAWSTHRIHVWYIYLYICHIS